MPTSTEITRTWLTSGQGNNVFISHAGDPRSPDVDAPEQMIRIGFGPFMATSVFWYELEFAGEIDLDTATMENVATVIYELNGSPVTGVINVVQDDTILFKITKTTASLLARIDFVIELAGVVFGVNSQAFEWSRWQNLTNSVAEPMYFNDHDGWRSTGAAGPWNKSATTINQFQGAGEIQIEYKQNIFRGLSTGAVTFPPTHFSRIQHAIYMINGSLMAYEFGVSMASVAFGEYTQGRIIDTGASVLTQYSLDDGATWITFYTSLITYVPNTIWYGDIVARNPHIIDRGIKMISANML